MQGLVAGLRLVDRFELIRPLGRGGMGHVWLARDAELGEDVALKILTVSPSGTSDYAQLLKDECRKARALVHPNIVRMHDIHVTEDSVFVSMQFIDGESLEEAQAQTFQQVVSDMLVLCDALDYAHRSGVVHRDIKPANVLRDKRGAIYLGDFGIAAMPGDESRAQPRGGGSLPYLSPQQVQGDAPGNADDTYALGALMFALLAGHPPFHPGVTRERVLTEQPQIPAQDMQGQALPDGLGNLLAACLAKEPQQRPAGMAAVRAVLEEIESDYGATEITPVRRRAAAAAQHATAPAVPTVLPDAGKRSLPAGVVYGGLGALLLVALAVVFFLPSFVAERRASAPPPAASVPDPAAAPTLPPAASEAQRGIADEALGEVLVLDGQLREVGVTLWGGQEWRQAREYADNGDAAYRDRDFAQATVRYREALALMRELQARAPAVLADAMSSAAAAFAIGNQTDAVSNYEIALAIDKDNVAAREGLARAMQLNRVLELMGEGQQYESANEIVAAQESYSRVLELDPQWQPALEGFARTSGSLQTTRYERDMAAGYEALGSRRFGAAREAFRAALRAKPGDADAQRALRQVDSEQQLEKVVSLQSQAEAFVAQERWADAAKAYTAALDVDATLVSAQQGQARSQARGQLDLELQEQIGRADRFYETPVYARAREVLQQAQEIEDPGPRLAGQIGELATLLARAAIPVDVRFESDNLTEVVIYKVGRLGTFFTQSISLKPGSYVAVGSRPGFRDVRRSFSVSSDGEPGPIVLRCEEPI